jgi:hypothetical protein
MRDITTTVSWHYYDIADIMTHKKLLNQERLSDLKWF